jgi:hypothetical protein
MIQTSDLMSWLRGNEPLPLHAAVELTPERLARIWPDEFSFAEQVEVLGRLRPARFQVLMFEFAGALAERHIAPISTMRASWKATIARARVIAQAGGANEHVNLDVLPVEIYWALVAALARHHDHRIETAMIAVDRAGGWISDPMVQRIFSAEPPPALEEILVANQRRYEEPR